MSNNFMISVHAFGVHKDFTNLDMEELENYLDQYENDYRREFYNHSDYLYTEVTKALKIQAISLVTPIGHDDDLTVDFTYEG